MGPRWWAGHSGPVGGGGATGEGTYQQAALLRPQEALVPSRNDRGNDGMGWGASFCLRGPVPPLSCLPPAPHPHSSLLALCQLKSWASTPVQVQQGRSQAGAPALVGSPCRGFGGHPMPPFPSPASTQTPSQPGLERTGGCPQPHTCRVALGKSVPHPPWVGRGAPKEASLQGPARHEGRQNFPGQVDRISSKAFWDIAHLHSIAGTAGEGGAQG